MKSMLSATQFSQLCNLLSAGPHHVDDLDKAGGIQAVMKELAKDKLIDAGLVTVTTKKISDNFVAAPCLTVR